MLNRFSIRTGSTTNTKQGNSEIPVLGSIAAGTPIGRTWLLLFEACGCTNWFSPAGSNSALKIVCKMNLL